MLIRSNSTDPILAGSSATRPGSGPTGSVALGLDATVGNEVGPTVGMPDPRLEGTGVSRTVGAAGALLGTAETLPAEWGPGWDGNAVGSPRAGLHAPRTSASVQHAAAQRLRFSDSRINSTDIGAQSRPKVPARRRGGCDIDGGMPSRVYRAHRARLAPAGSLAGRTVTWSADIVATIPASCCHPRPPECVMRATTSRPGGPRRGETVAFRPSGGPSPVLRMSPAHLQDRGRPHRTRTPDLRRDACSSRRRSRRSRRRGRGAERRRCRRTRGAGSSRIRALAPAVRGLRARPVRSPCPGAPAR